MGLKLKGALAVCLSLATSAQAAPESWSCWDAASKVVAEYVRHRSGFWGPHNDGPYMIRRDDGAALIAIRGHSVLAINKGSRTFVLTKLGARSAGECVPYHVSPAEAAAWGLKI